MSKKSEVMKYLGSEEIIDFINRNEGNNTYRKDLIKMVSKKFDMREKTVEDYYYLWKKQYMKTDNCVPKNRTKDNGEIIKKKNGEKFLILDKSELLNSDFEVVQMIKGKYRMYEKQGHTVKVGDMIFRTESDIENYKKREIEKFMLELGEILEVMYMEV